MCDVCGEWPPEHYGTEDGDVCEFCMRRAYERIANEVGAEALGWEKDW